jgi:hypothetical protein
MSTQIALATDSTPLQIPQSTNPTWINDESESTSFVELILMASECSEDESEVRDLVDSLFQSERQTLRDMREEQILDC